MTRARVSPLQDMGQQQVFEDKKERRPGYQIWCSRIKPMAGAKQRLSDDPKKVADYSIMSADKFDSRADDLCARDYRTLIDWMSLMHCWRMPVIISRIRLSHSIIRSQRVILTSSWHYGTVLSMHQARVGLSFIIDYSITTCLLQLLRT